MGKAIYNAPYRCQHSYDTGICSLCTRRDTCSAYLAVKRRAAFHVLPHTRTSVVFLHPEGGANTPRREDPVGFMPIAA